MDLHKPCMKESYSLALYTSKEEPELARGLYQFLHPLSDPLKAVISYKGDEFKFNNDFVAIFLSSSFLSDKNCIRNWIELNNRKEYDGKLFYVIVDPIVMSVNFRKRLVDEFIREANEIEDYVNKLKENDLMQMTSSIGELREMADNVEKIYGNINDTNATTDSDSPNLGDQLLKFARGEFSVNHPSVITQKNIALAVLRSDRKLAVEIEVPDDLNEEELQNLAKEAVLGLDNLHRSYGGRGLKVVDLQIVGEEVHEPKEA